MADNDQEEERKVQVEIAQGRLEETLGMVKEIMPRHHDAAVALLGLTMEPDEEIMQRLRIKGDDLYAAVDNPIQGDIQTIAEFVHQSRKLWNGVREARENGRTDEHHGMSHAQAGMLIAARAERNHLTCPSGSASRYSRYPIHRIGGLQQVL